MTVLQDGVSLQHVVDGLNALGVGPARHHLHPAGDQGGRRAAGRNPGDRLMDAAHPKRDDDGRSSRRWPRRPSRPASAAKADAASKEFESVFISQFLGSHVLRHQDRRPHRRRPGRGDVPLPDGRSICQGHRTAAAASAWPRQMKAELLKHQQVRRHNERDDPAHRTADRPGRALIAALETDIAALKDGRPPGAGAPPIRKSRN